jgi:transcriptional regulator with XRE-family HTH domain
MTLFERIKKYAKLRGMSLTQVAKRSGLSDNAIYGWKKHTPNEATLRTVARVLGVTYKELTGEDDDGTAIKQIDLKATMHDDHTVVAWDGKPIPPEEMEMIRRILDGGK